MTDVEEALRESMECAAGLGPLQLEAKQLEEITCGSDGVTDSREINLLRRSGLGERKFRNDMEGSGFLPSAVKFGL